MAKPVVPRYHGLRIYMSSSLLLFFLVMPFLLIIAFQNVPKFIDDSGNGGGLAMADSLLNASGLTDSIRKQVMDVIESGDFDPEEVDSIVNRAVSMGMNYADSLKQRPRQGIVTVEGGDEGESVSVFEPKGPFGTYFLILFFGSIAIYLAGFLYNRPFKLLFRRKRKGKDFSGKIATYCRKQLFRTPVINSVIMILPNVAVIVVSVIDIFRHGSFEQDAERHIFIQLHYLTLVATLLEFLFVYYWQKHRVHIRYIGHIYSEEELRKQVFRKKGGRIRDRFLLASAMTTFLPLMIVIVYLLLGLTSLKSLDLDPMTSEQRDILIGPWGQIFHNDEEADTGGNYQRLYYVNAVDTVLMLFGIGSGILVSLIYLLLFIRWTNSDISVPIKELLSSIRNTRAGGTGHYALVRTNDEIGELAEGYNEMTSKIHEYVQNISRMNRELEDKVKERTGEVVQQKEEIEAQKEEIEAQLDLVTEQRDTITRQKDQIVDSIRYAERIQTALLPPLELLSQHLADHFVLFMPRDIVSGDYYWILQKENRLLVAVADCTGHGVPGAFLSMLGISSMNEIVNRRGTMQPGQILEELRAFIINSLHQTGTRDESQDGIEIALCVLDTEKMKLEFAGANRPLFLVRKGRLRQIKGDRMPIGIYEQDPLPFTNHELELERGDILYLFSDGYVDQLGGSSRKTFRIRQFREFLLEIRKYNMAEQQKLLVEKLDAWRGKVEQIDDILVVGLKV